VTAPEEFTELAHIPAHAGELSCVGNGNPLSDSDKKSFRLWPGLGLLGLACYLM